MDQTTITVLQALAPIVSAVVTAGIAITITPMMVMFQVKAACDTAARQIRASTITANRQAWVNSLRENIAEFITAVTVAAFALLTPSNTF